MTEVNLTTVLAMGEQIDVRSEGDDGALLHNTATGEVTLLNATAAAICRLLDGRRSVAEVLAALGEEFDSMGTDAPAQVLSVAQALVNNGAARIPRT